MDSDLLEALKRVKTFDLTIDELQRRHAERLSYKPGQAFSQVTFNHPTSDTESIPVADRDIQRALDLFLEGQLTAERLREWADFLILTDCYEWSGEKERLIASLMHMLGSPLIHRPLNRETVRYYIICLEANEQP